MKRTFAVLAILFLFAASMVSYAEYCVISPKACAVKIQTESICPHEAQATEADEGCCEAVRDECQSAPACGGSSCAERVDECEGSLPCEGMSCTDKVKECASNPDCVPRICRLRPPLLADGPNRVKGHIPQTAEFRPTPILASFESASYSKMPVAPPPWGIHPSIAMTVLRI